MSIRDGEIACDRWRSRRGGREFLTLMAGQTISDAGSQATTVALPLLALLISGSPFEAGLVGFARALAYPLTALPAGVAADRCDRRRLLLISALGRVAAMATVLVTLLVGHPPVLELALVAFADSALWTLAAVTERGVFRALVPAPELPRAIALSQGREAAASIVGPPLGGALLAAGRALPFAFDALSSVAAIVAVLRVRTPLAPAADGRRVAAGFRGAATHAVEGIRWLWRRPFMRDGALLYTAANLSLSALELLALLVAQHFGAGTGAIGLMFAIMGVGGVLGALVANRVTAFISPRWAIALEPCLVLGVVPVLLVVHNPVVIGVLGAPVFISTVLGSATVVSRRVALTPDALQGRVQAGASLIATSLAWIGPLAVGAVFAGFGPSAAVLMVTGWALVVTTGALLSPSLRHPPALETAAES
ncbi:MAG: hypothetical protein QOF83_2330 [Solirubrobacteraceae bacterium]|nr:hypothetical protein [Solirubrobacteraceae bacterium]